MRRRVALGVAALAAVGVGGWLLWRMYLARPVGHVVFRKDAELLTPFVQAGFARPEVYRFSGGPVDFRLLVISGGHPAPPEFRAAHKELRYLYRAVDLDFDPPVPRDLGPDEGARYARDGWFDLSGTGGYVVLDREGARIAVYQQWKMPGDPAPANDQWFNQSFAWGERERGNKRPPRGSELRRANRRLTLSGPLASYFSEPLNRSNHLVLTARLGDGGSGNSGYAYSSDGPDSRHGNEVWHIEYETDDPYPATLVLTATPRARVAATRDAAAAEVAAAREAVAADPASATGHARLARALLDQSRRFDDAPGGPSEAELVARSDEAVAAARAALQREPDVVSHRTLLQKTLFSSHYVLNRSPTTAARVPGVIDEMLSLTPPLLPTYRAVAELYATHWSAPNPWPEGVARPGWAGEPWRRALEVYREGVTQHRADGPTMLRELDWLRGELKSRLQARVAPDLRGELQAEYDALEGDLVRWLSGDLPPLPPRTTPPTR